MRAIKLIDKCFAIKRFADKMLRDKFIVRSTFIAEGNLSMFISEAFYRR